MSINSFCDSDNYKSVGMDTSVCFLTTKRNDGNIISPFIYMPLASELSSDDSCSDTRKDHDGSGSSDEDRGRLSNMDLYCYILSV